MNKEAMSTSRVAEADAMAVDEAGGVAPSREWMQAAQRALETDGILDGSPSKRHKVCICTCSCTLMSSDYSFTARRQPLWRETLSDPMSTEHDSTKDIKRFPAMATIGDVGSTRVRRALWGSVS